MAKFIGVKMIEAVPMRASMALSALMVYMLYVKLALIELALLNLMISLEPLRVLRTLRYTPRRGWNGSCASNISIVINDNDYID